MIIKNCSSKKRFSLKNGAFEFYANEDLIFLKNYAKFNKHKFSKLV